MVSDADRKWDSKPQQLRATVTMPPIMAPLNMIVNVVINEEDSADGMLPASVEDAVELELDEICAAEIGCELPVSQTKCDCARDKSSTKQIIFTRIMNVDE